MPYYNYTLFNHKSKDYIKIKAARL